MQKWFKFIILEKDKVSFGRRFRFLAICIHYQVMMKIYDWGHICRL